MKYLKITLGTLLMTFGVYLFKIPNGFSTGGVSGLATVLGKVIPNTNITPGALIMIINVYLFLYFQYKMSFTLMLVGLIFVPSTVILYDNLIKHLSVSVYQKFISRKVK